MNVAEIREKIRPILEAYGTRYAGVFGSVARGSATPKSDIDILIELKQPIGVYAFIRMQNELSELLGRRVDMVARGALDPLISPYIEKDLQPIYEV